MITFKIRRKSKKIIYKLKKASRKRKYFSQTNIQPVVKVKVLSNKYWNVSIVPTGNLTTLYNQVDL